MSEQEREPNLVKDITAEFRTRSVSDFVDFVATQSAAPSLSIEIGPEDFNYTKIKQFNLSTPLGQTRSVTMRLTHEQYEKLMEQQKGLAGLGIKFEFI